MSQFGIACNCPYGPSCAHLWGMIVVYISCRRRRRFLTSNNVIGIHNKKQLCLKKPTHTRLLLSRSWLSVRCFEKADAAAAAGNRAEASKTFF